MDWRKVERERYVNERLWVEAEIGERLHASRACDNQMVACILNYWLTRSPQRSAPWRTRGTFGTATSPTSGPSLTRRPTFSPASRTSGPSLASSPSRAWSTSPSRPTHTWCGARFLSSIAHCAAKFDMDIRAHFDSVFVKDIVHIFCVYAALQSVHQLSRYIVSTHLIVTTFSHVCLTIYLNSLARSGSRAFSSRPWP